MNLSDTPDDSLRYAAERGMAERLARCKSDYEAAERALHAAHHRSIVSFGATATLRNPPWFVREAWSARDAAYDAWVQAEEVNEQLQELAEAQEAAEWRLA